MRIECPGQDSNPFAGDPLLRGNVIGSIPAWRQNQICVTQRAPAQTPQRLPDINPMRADNALQTRRHKLHRLHHRTQIRVRGEDQFCFAPRCPQCRHCESPLGVLATREHKFPLSHPHPVQLRRVIQADQAAIHAVAGGEFREHRRQVAAHPLHPAGCVQFWKEANEHAQSLPTGAPNGKCGCIGV